MMNPCSRVAPLAAAVLLSFSPVALAQSATAPGTTGGAAPAAPATSAAPANPAQQRVEARIKQLHTDLRITSAEEPQWNQFAQTMRDNAREIDEVAEQRSQQFPTMTAVQNLESYERLAEAHAQHLQKLIPAFQSLYSAMSPDQQKVADGVFRATAQARAQAQGASNR